MGKYSVNIYKVFKNIKKKNYITIKKKKLAIIITGMRWKMPSVKKQILNCIMYPDKIKTVFK